MSTLSTLQQKAPLRNIEKQKAPLRGLRVYACSKAILCDNNLSEISPETYVPLNWLDFFDRDLL